MAVETRVVAEGDAQAVDGFLRRSFYQDEPLVKANQLLFWEHGLHYRLLHYGVSIAAVDPDERVVGVMINDNGSGISSCYNDSPSDVKFQDFFDHMSVTAEVRKIAPGAGEIRLLGVDSAWRGRGVARKMVAASVDAYRRAGVKWLKVYCTNFYSHLLFGSMGWKLICDVAYADYAEKFGVNIISPPEPHDRCYLYILDLFKT